jgi:hypothetical protein
MPVQANTCDYLAAWVAVKVRWRLTMDQSEAARIANLLAASCPGWTTAQPAIVP